MKAVFDELAKDYDVDFSESATGKMQRHRVWYFLKKRILKSGKSKILEVNCGTGVDAVWLAEKGNIVLATDVSEDMITKALSKKFTSNLQFQRAGFAEISGLSESESLDLIFSDFGGLNCISSPELEKFLSDSYELLKPGGSLALVIMPRFCLWESVYYLFKKPSIAFRRLQKKAKAMGFKLPLDVYYFNPSDLLKLSKGKFQIAFSAPIGFFLPPSYLENFFSTRPSLLGFLNRLERMVGRFSFLSKLSDHYIIQLTKAK
jgi:ubiquinone/menaquinone biosynthesis C-methylase UbiE